MKTVLTILFSVIVVVAVAQERRAGPSKTMEDVQNRCMTVNGSVTSSNIVEEILGTGIAYSNVSFQGYFGAPGTASLGLFSGANCVPLGFDQGIILGSGTILNAVGPNITDYTTANLGLPGDPDLNALVFPLTTFDASWIKFDFVPTGNTISIQYVFGSEEYNEYVGSSYNDVFGFFVNGVNIALIPSTSIPVSINNVNLLYNSTFYRNNSPGPYNIEADGMTTVLTATAAVTPGVPNTIKIAVADVGDRSFDSWVFIKASSFTSTNPNIPVSNWALYLGILLIITFMVIRFRRML